MGLGISRIGPLAVPAAPASEAAGVSGMAGRSAQAVLDVLGLSAPPTLDDVLAAQGIDRNLRMALFIQTASSAELAHALRRCAKEELWHPALTDPIWVRWTELDPLAAIASKENSGQAWWAWAITDPKAALAAAAGKTPDLQKVIRTIGEIDPAWARRLLAEHPEADGPSVWDRITEKLSLSDPAAAANLAVEKGASLQGLLAHWAGRQPEAAFAWVHALQEGPVKRKAAEIAIRELSRTNPAAGLAATAKLPAGQTRDALNTTAVLALSSSDLTAARNVAQALPAGLGREQALGCLAEKIAGSQPHKALEVLTQISWKEIVSGEGFRWDYYVGEGIGRGTGFDRDNKEPLLSAKGALGKLLEHDAAGTVAALAAQPPEREAPLAEAIKHWAGTEPEAASAWLRDQPAGEVSDRGIDGLVNVLLDPKNNDFDAALIWAGNASPAGREKLLRKTLNRYSQTDQAAAAAKAAELGIGPGRFAAFGPSMPY